MQINGIDQNRNASSSAAAVCLEIQPASNSLLKVPGNSGCAVSTESFDGRLVVKKQAPSPVYAARLDAQRVKQETCRPGIGGVVVPRILWHDSDSFLMEFLPMLDHIDFFERAAPDLIRSRLNLIVKFLANEFHSAVQGKLERSAILKKLGEIKAKVSPHLWDKHYSSAAREVARGLASSLPVPLGPCHGDLTLSNVLFSLDEPKIGLLDFLDSFVESPVIDLIKLRQDTRHLWTSKRYPRAHDKGKIYLVNRWIDSILTEQFAEYINLASFRVLEVMNYLRIAPYVGSREEHTYLGNVLDNILGESHIDASCYPNFRPVHAVPGASAQMDAHPS